MWLDYMKSELKKAETYIASSAALTKETLWFSSMRFKRKHKKLHLMR